MGQPIRVSQALSMVMVVVAAVMLFYNIKIKKRTADGLLVNQVSAAAAAETAETVETVEDASLEEILAEETSSTEEEETEDENDGDKD